MTAGAWLCRRRVRAQRQRAGDEEHAGDAPHGPRARAATASAPARAACDERGSPARDAAPAAKKPALRRIGWTPISKCSSCRALTCSRSSSSSRTCCSTSYRCSTRVAAWPSTAGWWALMVSAIQHLSWAVPLAVESLPRTVEEIGGSNRPFDPKARGGRKFSWRQGSSAAVWPPAQRRSGTGAKYAHAVAGRSRSRVPLGRRPIASAPPGEALAELRVMFEQASTMKGASPSCSSTTSSVCLSQLSIPDGVPHR